MAHNPMDFNNDGRANYTDFMISQTTMNRSSSNGSGCAFSSLITIAVVIFFGIALCYISPFMGASVIVMCILFFLLAIPTGKTTNYKETEHNIGSTNKIGRWRCQNCGQVNFDYSVSCTCGCIRGESAPVNKKAQNASSKVEESFYCDGYFDG